MDLITKKKFSRREFVKLTSGGIFLVTSSLWLPRSAWAATVTRHINSASSGGDGTGGIDVVSGSTAAYASIAAHEAAEQTDLVSAGDSHVGNCKGSLAGHTIDGWTTSGSNALTYKADASAYHDGTPGSGTNISGEAVVNENYVIYEDLTFTTGTGYDEKSIQLNGCSNLVVRRCVFSASSTSAFTSAIGAYGGDAGGSNQGATVENCFISGHAKGGIISQPEGWGPQSAFNCHCNTIQAIAGHGDYSASAACSISAVSTDTYTFDIYNTLVGDATASIAVRFDAALGDFSGDYNASEDSLLPGANTIDNGTITTSTSPGAGTFYIVDTLTAGSEDLHIIDDSDNDVLQAGDDTGMPTDDIDRNTRTGTYDIGAHQVSTAGGGGGSTPQRMLTGIGT